MFVRLTPPYFMSMKVRRGHKIYKKNGLKMDVNHHRGTGNINLALYKRNSALYHSAFSLALGADLEVWVNLYG